MAADYASHVIDQEPGITKFEQPAGDRLLHEHMAEQNLDDLDVWEQAFNRLILPAAVAPITRAGYYAMWRSLVTFAYIMNAMDELLPMSERLIKAFILQAVLIGYSVGTITGYVAAIKHRHKIRKIGFMIEGDDLRTWCHALHKNRGMPSTPKFKILPAHLKMAMQIPWATLARLRDICIFTIGTVCAMRASEVTQLDVCDLSWDHDGPDTLMLRIKHRKNGMKREGLFPRIGASQHKRFDVLQMLRMYLGWAKLKVQRGCTKKLHPADECTTCGKLFRLTHPDGKQVQARGVTKTHVTSAVQNVLSLIGVDATGYSGISMRKGGVSAAVIGGIPHDLRTMQTGHKSSAWEHYFDLAEKKELYKFFSVFGL